MSYVRRNWQLVHQHLLRGPMFHSPLVRERREVETSIGIQLRTSHPNLTLILAGIDLRLQVLIPKNDVRESKFGPKFTRKDHGLVACIQEIPSTVEFLTQWMRFPTGTFLEPIVEPHAWKEQAEPFN